MRIAEEISQWFKKKLGLTVSIGVRGAGLVLNTEPEQLNMFKDSQKREKMRKLDNTIGDVRRRFGYFSL